MDTQKIVFKGKAINNTDSLSAIGVKEGDFLVIMIVAKVFIVTIIETWTKKIIKEIRAKKGINWKKTVRTIKKTINWKKTRD